MSTTAPAETEFPAWTATESFGDPACPRCKGHGTMVRTDYAGPGQRNVTVSCWTCGGWDLWRRAYLARKAAA